MTTDEPRRLYQMTDAQYAALTAACGPDATDAAMTAAWTAFGSEMGFDYKTVIPTPMSDRVFTAVPTA